jgi:ribosomal protein L29
MKTKELRKKTREDSLKLLAEKKKSYYDIRFVGENTKSKNTKELTNLRKDIARIKTILKETNEDDQ